VKPLLIDLCCGEGGAATGYSAAGFDVIGGQRRLLKGRSRDAIIGKVRREALKHDPSRPVVMARWWTRREGESVVSSLSGLEQQRRLERRSA
jgi:hypothetical protein